MQSTERSDEGEVHGARDWKLEFSSAGLFAAGFWMVHVVMLHADAYQMFSEAKIEYRLWIVVLGAAFGFAIAAVPYYFRWLHGLARDTVHPVRSKQYVSWVGLIVVGLIGLYLSIGAAGGKPESAVERSLSGPVGLITGPGILLSIPGLLLFFVVASTAADEANWKAEPALKRILLVIRLRAEIRRLLGTLGVLLTLLVIATGMRRRALLALDQGIKLPPEFVILYGLTFAGLLGFFFVLASRSVSARANLVIDELTPIPSPDDARFSELLGYRGEVVTLLGGGGVFESFQTVVVIAGPLVTALLGNALSG